MFAFKIIYIYIYIYISREGIEHPEMNFRVMSAILVEVLHKARLSRCEHRGYFFLRIFVFVEGTRYSFSGLYGYVKIFIPRFHAPGRSFTICLFHRSQWNFQWLLHNVAQFLLVRNTITAPHKR